VLRERKLGQIPQDRSDPWRPGETCIGPRVYPSGVAERCCEFDHVQERLQMLARFAHDPSATDGAPPDLELRLHQSEDGRKRSVSLE